MGTPHCEVGEPSMVDERLPAAQHGPASQGLRRACRPFDRLRAGLGKGECSVLLNMLILRDALETQLKSVEEERGRLVRPHKETISVLVRVGGQYGE